jgi:tetratricopeptide (TPR) repeat protein
MLKKGILALVFTTMTAAGALAQEDTGAQASFEQAKRHYRNRSFREAVTELTRTVELEPTRADALYLLGYSHLEIREFPQAVDAFGRAFAADPTFDPRTIFQPPAQGERSEPEARGAGGGAPAQE